MHIRIRLLSTKLSIFPIITRSTHTRIHTQPPNRSVTQLKLFFLLISYHFEQPNHYLYPLCLRNQSQGKAKNLSLASHNRRMHIVGLAYFCCVELHSKSDCIFSHHLVADQTATSFSATHSQYKNLSTLHVLARAFRNSFFST